MVPSGGGLDWHAASPPLLPEVGWNDMLQAPRSWSLKNSLEVKFQFLNLVWSHALAGDAELEKKIEFF
jgi:hypothetical protein